ncbi:MAG: uroporphyrinogen-III synthase [Coriobacteriia bacterium]
MGGDRDTSAVGGGQLTGCRVLVTRAPHQAAGLAGPLEALGAEVVIAPVIDTIEPRDWAPADAAIAELASYGWVVFTSTNAVERFLGRMREIGFPLSALDLIRVAAVGPSTAERLSEFGVQVHLVPSDYRAEGLVDEFARAGAGPGWRVLIPRAERAREILPESLRASGAHVDVVPVYRTVPAVPAPDVVALLRAGAIDVITFTSPSTVRHFLAWLEAAGLDPSAVMARVAAASIGAVTSAALRARGYAAAVEAESSTAAGLVTAIAAHCSPGS